jgi:hypothetical protein
MRIGRWLINQQPTVIECLLALFNPEIQNSLNRRHIAHIAHIEGLELQLLTRDDGCDGVRLWTLSGKEALAVGGTVSVKTLTLYSLDFDFLRKLVKERSRSPR